MTDKYTPADLDARLRFVIGCVLGAVLLVTTIGVLYALVFVAQPIGAQAENDKMFFYGSIVGCNIYYRNPCGLDDFIEDR